MRTLFLLSCVLAIGAAGCGGRANCADLAKAYCDRATNDCGAGSCSTTDIEALCTAQWGTNCDLGPCIDAVKTASCNDPLACSAKCPTG